MKKKFPKKHLPPIEILLERLDYDPIKGEFYWKIDIPNNRIKKGDLVKGSRKKSHSNIYIYIGINGNQYAAQRLAWYIYYKEDPYPLDVDHINNNTLDNSIKNLQLLTTVENNKKKKIYQNNCSGLSGIRQTVENKWRVDGSDKGSNIYIGTFETKEAAIQARQIFNDKKGHSCYLHYGKV